MYVLADLNVFRDYFGRSIFSVELFDVARVNASSMILITHIHTHNYPANSMKCSKLKPSPQTIRITTVNKDPTRLNKHDIITKRRRFFRVQHLAKSQYVLFFGRLFLFLGVYFWFFGAFRRIPPVVCLILRFIFRVSISMVCPFTFTWSQWQPK